MIDRRPHHRRNGKPMGVSLLDGHEYEQSATKEVERLNFDKGMPSDKIPRMGRPKKEKLK